MRTARSRRVVFVSARLPGRRALVYSPHMRTLRGRLLIGATLLVAGFGVLTDGAPLRLVDFKDKGCREASVAVGSACPAGCVARPARTPEDRATATECHSKLWVATCGKDCDPGEGFARDEDGRLADGRKLIVTMNGVPGKEHDKAAKDLGIVIEPRFDGMYRYDVLLPEGGDLEKAKKRLAALPGIRSVEYVYR